MTEQPFRPNRPVRPIPKQLITKPARWKDDWGLTDSVNISLDIGSELALGAHDGHVVVDDHVDLLNVDTPSDDVGRDEDFGLSITESVQNRISLVALFLSVQRGDRVALAVQPVGDPVRSVFALKQLVGEGLLGKNKGSLTRQKTILCPMDIQSYSSDSALYFWSSPSHSRYSCLIASTVTSSFFRKI